jgi:cell division topological specificity factor
MFEFIQRLFGKEESKSKDVAKERLRLVLVHDRASVSPQFLETIKEELIRVISKYMDIEQDALDVQLTTEDNSVALIANIPVKNVRRTVKDEESH